MHLPSSLDTLLITLSSHSPHVGNRLPLLPTGVSVVRWATVSTKNFRQSFTKNSYSWYSSTSTENSPMWHIYSAYMNDYLWYPLCTPVIFGYISWDGFGTENFIRSVHCLTFLFFRSLGFYRLHYVWEVCCKQLGVTSLSSVGWLSSYVYTPLLTLCHVVSQIKRKKKKKRLNAIWLAKIVCFALFSLTAA